VNSVSLSPPICFGTVPDATTLRPQRVIRTQGWLPRLRLWVFFNVPTQVHLELLICVAMPSFQQSALMLYKFTIEHKDIVSCACHFRSLSPKTKQSGASISILQLASDN
jgi:hypothetical protein